MLCSETFGKLKLVYKHNCKRCGKAVCENCSKSRRRLSQLNPEKLRICDECDALLANHMLEKMFQRELAFKKSTYEELKGQVKDMEKLISQNQHDLKHAQSYWDDKIKETDGRIAIRE